MLDPRHVLGSFVRTGLSIGPLDLVLGASTPVGRALRELLPSGPTPQQAIERGAMLADVGLRLSFAHPTIGDREAALADCWAMVSSLADAGLGPIGEIVVAPMWLTGGDTQAAMILSRELCTTAHDLGVPVVLACGPGDPMSELIEIQSTLWAEGLQPGITVQAVLRRSERDCASLPGRIRLIKGEDPSTKPEQFNQPIEVGKSFVRCAKVLVRRHNEIEPSIGTHDHRLVEIVQAIVARAHLDPGAVEYAVFDGQSTRIQMSLLAAGEPVRTCLVLGSHDI